MNTPAGRHGRILGTLTVADGKGIVRMQDRLDTDIEDLWSACTDPARLGRWLGEVQGDLRVGGEFRAHFFASGWEGTGRIEICEPPSHFRVLTRQLDGTVEGPVDVRLTADGDQTLLVWEEEVPAELIADYGAGIQVHVEDLAAHIAGGERHDAAVLWQALLPAYQALAAELG